MVGVHPGEDLALEVPEDEVRLVAARGDEPTVAGLIKRLYEQKINWNF